MTSMQVKQGWQKTLLEEVLDFFNGKSIKAQEEGLYPVYGSNGVIGKCDEFKYEDAIVLGRVGAYCGSVNYEKGKLWASDNTIVVKSKELESNRFFYYLLKNLNLNFYAGGAAQPLITQRVVKKIETKIPSSKIQQKIASILSAFDDLIENNTKRIKILENTAQLIYKEWFVDFKFPNHEKVKMVDSGTEFGVIPEGWEVKELSQVAKVNMGQSPKSEYYNDNEEGLPFHQGVTNFNNRFPTHSKYCTAEKVRIADEGDILFSVRAPVGRINIAPSKLVIGRGLSAIRDLENHQSFLLYQLKHIFYEDNLLGNGAIFAAITSKDLKSVQVLLPNHELKVKFEKIVGEIDAEIKNLTDSNTKLRATRDLLLPKLVSGEVEVEVDNLMIKTDYVS